MNKKTICALLLSLLLCVGLFAQKQETLSADREFKTPDVTFTLQKGSKVVYYSNGIPMGGILAKPMRILYEMGDFKTLVIYKAGTFFELHPEGHVKSGRVEQNALFKNQFGDFMLKADGQIAFWPNRRVRRLELAPGHTTLKFAKDSYIISRYIEFDVNGWPSETRFPVAQKVSGGYWIQGNESRVFFHPNGKIKRATLDKNHTETSGKIIKKKKTYKANQTYDFNSSGDIK